MQVNLKSVSEYKRYNSYAEICNFVELPEVQRNIISKQLENMRIYVSDCIEKGMEPIFGCIDLVKVSSYPKMFLVDGNHRYNIIQSFYNSNIHIPIHVMIYKVDTYEEMENIFRLRNLGVPVPEFLTVKAKDDIEGKKRLIKDIASWVENIQTFRYRNGNRPYVNISNFLDLLQKSKLYTIIDSIEDFEKVLNLLNTESYSFVVSLDDKGKRKHGITANMMKVWSDAKVYIGYNSNFPYLAPDYDISRFKTLLKKN
jgi:hypothetical protein